MNLSRLVFHSTLSSPKIDRLLIKLNQSAHAYHSLMSRPVQDCHTSQPLLLALSQRTRINVISQQLRSYRICTTPRTIISISEFPVLTPTNTAPSGYISVRLFERHRSPRMGFFCVSRHEIAQSASGYYRFVRYISAVHVLPFLHHTTKIRFDFPFAILTPTPLRLYRDPLAAALSMISISQDGFLLCTVV